MYRDLNVMDEIHFYHSSLFQRFLTCVIILYLGKNKDEKTQAEETQAKGVK